MATELTVLQEITSFSVVLSVLNLKMIKKKKSQDNFYNLKVFAYKVFTAVRWGVFFFLLQSCVIASYEWDLTCLPAVKAWLRNSAKWFLVPVLDVYLLCFIFAHFALGRATHTYILTSLGAWPFHWSLTFHNMIYGIHHDRCTLSPSHYHYLKVSSLSEAGVSPIPPPTRLASSACCCF